MIYRESLVLTHGPKVGPIKDISPFLTSTSPIPS